MIWQSPVSYLTFTKHYLPDYTSFALRDIFIVEDGSFTQSFIFDDLTLRPVALILDYAYETDRIGMPAERLVNPGSDIAVNITTKVWYMGSQMIFSNFFGTDSDGNVVFHMIYDAWGLTMMNTRLDMNYHGLDNINNFTGYTFDEVLGIYFAQHRFYDPNLRRFISQDPIRDGHNWYAYVANNPVTYIDPWGLAGDAAAFGMALGTAQAQQQQRDQQAAQAAARNEAAKTNQPRPPAPPAPAQQVPGFEAAMASQTQAQTVVLSGHPRATHPPTSPRRLGNHETLDCPYIAGLILAFAEWMEATDARQREQTWNSSMQKAQIVVDIQVRIGQIEPNSPEYYELLFREAELWFQQTTGIYEGLGAAGVRFVRQGLTKVTGQIANRTASINLSQKPVVSNQKLQNIVKDLYKGQGGPNQIGTGTTMDAVRNEILTGLPTHGTFHTQKLLQYKNALNSTLRTGNLDAHDTAVARALLDDIVKALSGQ